MSDKPGARVLDSWPAPAYASREAWRAAGARLIEARSTASWGFADWLKAGVDSWGEDAARDAAEASGNSPKKISNYLATATRYPPVRRRTALAFSHHLEVARLEPEAAERLLAQAEAEGWTHRRTREAARGASAAGENERLRRENAALKRQLRSAQLDSRDFAARARDRFAAGRRLMRDEGRRAASLAEAMAESEAMAAMHGNARRGLARDLLRLANSLAADTDATTARLAAAAGTLNQEPREPSI